MSDNGSNMQPVRPLTRREIREREQAAAAERAAQTGAPPPAPAAPAGGARGGQAASPAQPARPAAPPPSRRTLRESTGPTEFPSQPSVVRPPAASGGMRGLDETGRLTPVQETAERVAIRPPAPTPAVPTRTSSRPPVPGSRPQVPGASGPVRPPTPVGGLGAGASVGRIAAPGTPAGPGTPPAQPQRLSAFANATPSTTTPPPAARPPAPAPPTEHSAAQSPWGATAVAPAAPPAQPPAAASRPAATPAEAPAASLPWSAITSGSAPEPVGSGHEASAPFGSVRGAAPSPAAQTPQRGAASDDPFPRVHAGARTGADEDPEADDDLDDEPRGPSYTWLHYLILVAVAFVLGLLVWELVSRDDPGLSTDAAGVTWTVSDPAQAWGDTGPLDNGR